LKNRHVTSNSHHRAGRDAVHADRDGRPGPRHGQKSRALVEDASLIQRITREDLEQLFG
jgi:hypothetical protein